LNQKKIQRYNIGHEMIHFTHRIVSVY